jgi:hypothetical protein
MNTHATKRAVAVAVVGVMMLGFTSTDQVFSEPTRYRCCDILIVMSCKLPRQCETLHRRNLEEVSHGQHC